MKIVIAPDKFKGCLSAQEVAAAMGRGVRAVDVEIEVVEIPLADGGEGTVDALVAATGGRLVTRRVTGPLPEMKVDATFGVLGDGVTAVIEMAAASGLHLLRREQYDPMRTTTYGTGELLKEAFALGVQKVILGIGGSATVDGGIGCAQGCGATPIFMGDAESKSAPLTGADIQRVVGFSWPPKDAKSGAIVVACDVTNALFGANGAARVFGPQKGATSEQIERLDAALEQLAHRVEGGLELSRVPGAGAAGGLGFGLMVFLGAKLVPGFQIVAQAVGLEARLRGADLVITGEGRLDSSSLSGKTPIGVARMCKGMHVPCIAIVGSVGEGAAKALKEGLTAIHPIAEPHVTVEHSIARASEFLGHKTELIVREFLNARPARPR
jgi:glycerate kinase